jgi:dTDP-4-amino-4,6-dideoxygalactose transaminase
MTIPQTSPRLAYLAQREEIDAAIARVLTSDRYILGGEVENFEREFASRVGAEHAVGVGSGTDALHLSLRSCGIGSGDMVVTVANTAVATAAAIEMAGASIAFADVDPDTLTMSPDSLRSVLARFPGCRAVIPVHLYGRCAPMEDIVAVARERGLAVIEDCCQAHGATRNGRAAGSFGDVAAYSFYPTKNLGAIGDGGAVTTSDTRVAAELRLLRQYGWTTKDDSIKPGFNTRLDELQAAILRVKLRMLDADNERRRQIAASYDAALSRSVSTPPPDPGHVYHQYVIRTARRDELQRALRDAGIATLVHYPIPIHLQRGYAGRVSLPDGGLSVTEHEAGRILSLPMFPQMTDEQVGIVCAAIERFVES